jgi:DNA-binding MarR family transcriptional regulator
VEAVVSQRDHFTLLAFEAAVKAAIAAGIVEVWNSFEEEREWRLRLTDRGRKAFEALDLTSKEAMRERTS